MNKFLKLSHAAAGVTLAVAAAVQAQAQTQPPPDAGSLQRQIEQGQTPPLPRAQRPEPTRPPEFKPGGDIAVTVQRFEFRGNQRLADAPLQAAVAPWLNRPLSFADLQAAAAAAATVYREAGWIVRAYLPQQEIGGGTVTIEIIEAVLGQAQLQSAADLRLNPERARAMVLAAQPLGQPLNADAIDRALLIVQDLPGVNARGNLAAGQNDGETDLVVQLSARPLWAGEVGVDNTGARSTGDWRLTGTVYANSPLSLGDQATASLIHTKGQDYLRGAWSLPLGDNGLRGSVNVSALDYKVVHADFAALDLEGRSFNTGVSLNYPLIRSTARNLYLGAAADFKDYKNSSAGVATSDYKVRSATFTLSGSQYDEWLGGGLTQGALGLVVGNVNLGGSPNEASDAAAARTQGSYRKINYSAGRQQTLLSDLSLYAGLSGQLASKNLDSSERFYLGGAQGVRAYPASEAGGSDGTLVNLELRYRWDDAFSFTGFYDWGRVKVNHDSSFNGAALKNSLSLQGLGLSAGWATPVGANLKLSWAHRLGDNPNPTGSGKDQDGTLVKNRFWFMAAYPF